MRKPHGWQRLTSPHEIYQVGQPPLLVAYGRLAVAHALRVAARAPAEAAPRLVVGIVRTTAPRQWCVGLAHADGALTWIGSHRLRTEAETQAGAVADVVRQGTGTDLAAIASVVAEVPAAAGTPSSCEQV